MMKEIEIGFSPCPNDTFIFDALVNGKIDTGDYTFRPVMADVETLNTWALEGKLAVTKLSYGCMAPVMDRYTILDAGSALGNGVGPLLIGREPFVDQAPGQYNIAVPGQNTTAHMLLSLAIPEARKKEFVRYDEVEEFVLRGKGLGVIIHENRFTYQQKGLHLWNDLGRFWEENFAVPIPLGGIVAKKSLGDDAIMISQLIKESIYYAWRQWPALSGYVQQHAQEMEDAVMRNHINLYVNDFSLSLGEPGREAIRILLKQYRKLNPGAYEDPVFTV